MNSSDLLADTVVGSWPDWLRWMLVLPTALLGGVLIPGVILQGSQNAYVTGSPGYIGIQLLGAIGVGAFFVVSGAAMAPRAQRIVAVGLCALQCVLLSFVTLWALSLGASSSANSTILSPSTLMWGVLLALLAGISGVAYVRFKTT